MNFFITEVLVTVAVIVLVDGSSIEYYATKYDHLDVEEALSNRRMVKHYANCLLSRGPCTPQGLELKKILPEALATNCLRCTPRQKDVTYQAIKRLRKEYPKTWALLEAKWDPNNVLVKKFEESFQQKPSQGSYENEILIENRFGDTDSENDSPPTTSKAVTKKTKATTLRSSSVKPSTTKSFRPSLNSIASASDKKPSTIPPNTQNPLVNVTNQVGIINQENKVGNKKEVSSNKYDDVTQSTTISTSVTTSLISNSTHSSITQSTSSVYSSGVTFDIPTSSLKEPQSQKPLTQTSAAPKSPQTKKAPLIVTMKLEPSTTRQPDPISQLVFSFLNANRPRTTSVQTTSTTTAPENPNLQIRLPKISGLIRKAGVRNRPKFESTTTVNITLTRPVVQVRLPGVTVNNRIEPFNPVGNLVRGLANAGDRLIETGTSIADSVLTSVRGLFTPTARRNRALRRH